MYECVNMQITCLQYLGWQTDSCTDRLTDVRTDWPMYGQTDRCTDRLTDVRTDWPMYGQTDRCTDRLTDVRTDWPMYGQTDRCTDRLTDVRTDWPMYGQTDRCTDRLTDVQTDNPCSVCVHMNELTKTKPYSVLCFQGFWVKWEDHIWFWWCHKVTPNGVDVDASIVSKVSHIENWHHPATKDRY